MKKIVLLLALFTLFLSAGEYQNLWKEVKNFEHKSLPKSALQIVTKIYAEAKKTGDENQFIKALLYREKYLLERSEEGYLDTIHDIENAIDETPTMGSKLILYSILAQLYNNYLDKNYYKIESRTKLKENNSTDIQTWSIDKFYSKITNLYLKSLNSSAMEIPIDRYKGVIELGENTQELQPTLYDFLASRALKYFTNPNNRKNQEENLKIKTHNAFSSFYRFIYLTYSPIIESKLQHNALVIYQNLLKLHYEKGNKKALDYIDVQRLDFIYQHFGNDKKEEYYIKALKTMLIKNPKSEALLTLARFYYQRENYIEAMPYIKMAIASSNSYMVNRANNLRNSIEAKYLKFQLEEVHLPDENILSRVDYRNIDKIFVKVIKLTPKEERNLSDKKSEKIINYIKDKNPIREFEVILPKKDDYKAHATEISLNSYKLGHYIITLSMTKKINKNSIYKVINISNIAYMKQGDKKLLILHRKGGEPLEGVKVSFYKKVYNKNTHRYNLKFISTKRSDNNGKIDMPKIKGNFEMTFEYKDDFLDLQDSHYYNYYDNDKNRDSRKFVNFFTDRAIYRPNQTIYFKGLALESSNHKAPRILKDREIKVSFYDVNHQLIESKTFKTNSFGTFNGEFTAPKSGLLGAMSIEADIGGSKQLQIEEYKSPKFEIKFKKLDRSYKVGNKIELKGEAKAYAGNAIDGAKVNYRVERIASFPWIPYWSREHYKMRKETLSTGTTKTDKNGAFKIQFDALPNSEIDSKDRPNYTYTISVDITDSTGETHTATKNIVLGYVGIQIEMKIKSELNIEENKTLIVNSTNLDGKNQEIRGEVIVEKIIKEDKLYRKRYWKEPEEKLYSKDEFEKLFKNYRYSSKDRDKEKREELKSIKFDTKQNRDIELGNLEEGEYLLTLKSYDQHGVEVSKSKKIIIYDLKSEKPPIPTYLWHKNDQKEYKTPNIAKLYLKSSIDNLPIFLTIERRGKISQERWIRVKKFKDEVIKIAKEDRGNINYQLTFIHNNRAFHIEDNLIVPWNNRLKVEFITFRDKLKPNENEQWRLKISGENREKVLAEMVATMYDASLDQFLPHHFSNPTLFPTFRADYSTHWQEQNFRTISQEHMWQKYQKEQLQRLFPHLKWSNFINKNGRYGGAIVMAEVMPAPTMNIVSRNKDKIVDITKVSKKAEKVLPINIRKNFNATMFFKPNLQTDKEGNIIINFKTNEALTRWNFIGFVHTKDLKTAIINKTITTNKELMVVSNLPRFFREKDTITLSAKVVNMSKKTVDGECELKLVDPVTGKPIYPKKFKKYFHIKQGSSTKIEFMIKVPDVDKVSAIQHTLIARTSTHTDAEEVIKPILSNRVFVTESKAVSLKADENRSFTIKSLASNNSSTLKNHKLTLEFTSNPAWYAIQSLPYLMEYEHECSEQLFSRYYADALAQNIINKSPKIKAIFDEWRKNGRLKSKLTSNQELKSILLQETPWVLEAQSQEQQQNNIALLFDLDRLASKQKEALEKLEKRQLSSGGWSWFGGNRADWYITQYIVAGMGHLKTLGVDISKNRAIPKAIEYIDKQILNQYIKLLESLKDDSIKLKDDNLNSITIHYLYARSFYKKKMNKKVKKAHDYYLNQAKKFWKIKGVYEQGMIALALHRLGENANNIVNSLKEHSIYNDELGRYFKYTNGYHWNQLPIETQSLMIEVFETITDDKKMVENLKTWLLKQRETTHWRTTKATTSAIYALLSNSNWLENNSSLVEISFDTQKEYKTKLKEAKNRAIKGLGYFKVSYDKDEFDKSMATINIKNPNKNIAWGGIYWQYFEDMDKVKSFKATPLTIKKTLFKIEESKQGEELLALNQQMLKVGDRVKVRIEIRVDRDMEYIMLKDNRASTFEPVDVISQYRYQDGLGYYQSTKDNATYFFIDYLPKGVYIFEYPLVVTHKGEFSNGITTIESMYAPQFKSHSEGIKVFVE